MSSPTFIPYCSEYNRVNIKTGYIRYVYAGDAQYHVCYHHGDLLDEYTMREFELLSFIERNKAN